MANTGAFPNGYHLEPSSNIGGLAEVVATNPEKQTTFPVLCRDLTGGAKKKRKSRKKQRKSRKKQRKSRKKKRKSRKKQRKSRKKQRKSRKKQRKSRKRR